MLLTEKSKFSLIDTAAEFTLVYNELILNCTLQCSSTDVSGQYLGCKRTGENAHLLITANQNWVCTAGGPSAGSKAGSSASSCPRGAGLCVAQATVVLRSTPPSAALYGDPELLEQKCPPLMVFSTSRHPISTPESLSRRGSGRRWWRNLTLILLSLAKDTHLSDAHSECAKTKFKMQPRNYVPLFFNSMARFPGGFSYTNIRRAIFNLFYSYIGWIYRGKIPFREGNACIPMELHLISSLG